MGGSLTAVAPDFTRAALGVPAMNYSTLLQRSIDFDTYAQVMYNAYPNELERPLVLGHRSSCCGTAPRPTATRTT